MLDLFKNIIASSYFGTKWRIWISKETIITRKEKTSHLVASIRAQVATSQRRTHAIYAKLSSREMTRSTLMACRRESQTETPESLLSHPCHQKIQTISRVIHLVQFRNWRTASQARRRAYTRSTRRQTIKDRAKRCRIQHQILWGWRLSGFKTRVCPIHPVQKKVEIM